MNDIILKLSKKFDALSLRERILLCVVFCVVFYVIWHGALYNFVFATDEEIEAQAQQFREQISSMEGQLDAISSLIGRNPTAVLLNQMNALKKENEKINQAIYDNTAKMVSPQEMTRVLTEMIEKTKDLVVVNLQNLETKPLFDEKMLEVNGKEKKFQVFNHGLKIEVLGGYFETIRFLKALEEKHMNVIWDGVTYEVKKYPKAKIVIMLHTLSLEQGWIGV